MRIKEVKLYKFSELDADSQQTAIEQYRESNNEIFWQDELLDSFKAVFKESGIKLKDFELGVYGYCSVKFDMDDTVAELSGVRAYTWLENNLFCKLRITRSDYLANRKSYLSFGRSYRIGCIRPCPLTGYCADEDFLDYLKKSVLGGINLKDAYRGLADEYKRVLTAEWEYQNSDEYITEHIEANEYEYTEDGLRY